MALRWEDEEYVKLYVRDSGDWLTLSLPARCLYWELMRKCDRAGVIHVGAKGINALAALLRGTLAEFEAELIELIADGAVIDKGTDYVLPRFVDSQNAPRSDRSRKREQRVRDRDAVLGTERDTPQQPVTDSHDESRAVTNGHGWKAETVGEERRGEEINTSAANGAAPLKLTPEGPPEHAKDEGKGKARTKEKGDPNHVRLTKLWDSLYEAFYSRPYAWSGKEHKLVANLLGQAGYDEVAKRAELLLSDKCPPWIEGARDLGTLSSTFNRLVAAPPPTPRKDDLPDACDILAKRRAEREAANGAR